MLRDMSIDARSYVDQISDMNKDELDALPIGVITLDRHANVVRYNRTESELARKNAQAVIGTNFFVDVASCTAVPGAISTSTSPSSNSAAKSTSTCSSSGPTRRNGAAHHTKRRGPQICGPCCMVREAFTTALRLEERDAARHLFQRVIDVVERRRVREAQVAFACRTKRRAA